ncbi:hypothetical protein CGSHi22121_07465 [Haemophilus influenzae 22.1-21]|nr:hypothetical protein CGSHi22121_07465 [Haemophilus influenzae 22.1-21]
MNSIFKALQISLQILQKMINIVLFWYIAFLCVRIKITIRAFLNAPWNVYIKGKWGSFSIVLLTSFQFGKYKLTLCKDEIIISKINKGLVFTSPKTFN